MRRPLAAVAGTIAGLAALLSYRSGSPPARLSASPAGGVGTTSGTSPTTAPPATSSTPATAGSTRRTVTGSLVTTRYGPVQVQATVQGTRLVDVNAVVLPTDRARSAQISNQAAPLLRQEALAAQSANIHSVSGATYTSQAYARSLQAAIDAARRG